LEGLSVFKWIATVREWVKVEEDKFRKIEDVRDIGVMERNPGQRLLK
jgi:hypothetical protein